MEPFSAPQDPLSLARFEVRAGEGCGQGKDRSGEVRGKEGEGRKEGEER